MPFRMMDPPAADRALDAGIVRHVLSAQFPALALDAVEWLGSGWEHDVYGVDDRYVFRFPRYAEVAANLDHDLAILELVRSSVGPVLTVPRVLFQGRGGADFPHRFVGQVLVPGIGADDARVRPASASGSDLGRALTAVHAIRADAARAIGIGVADADCGAAYDALMRQVPVVPAMPELVPSAWQWLCGQPAIPAAYEGTPRFLHNDLHGEHIIVDPSTGRLSGIVDWSGVALGDPAVDFAFLLVLGGASFLEASLAAYGLPLDAGFVERVRFRARVRALGWLADTLRREVDPGRASEEVRRAFEP